MQLAQTWSPVLTFFAASSTLFGLDSANCVECECIFVLTSAQWIRYLVFRYHLPLSRDEMTSWPHNSVEVFTNKLNAFMPAAVMPSNPANDFVFGRLDSMKSPPESAFREWLITWMKNNIWKLNFLDFLIRKTILQEVWHFFWKT